MRGKQHETDAFHKTHSPYIKQTRDPHMQQVHRPNKFCGGSDPCAPRSLDASRKPSSPTFVTTSAPARPPGNHMRHSRDLHLLPSLPSRIYKMHGRRLCASAPPVVRPTIFVDLFWVFTHSPPPPFSRPHFHCPFLPPRASQSLSPEQLRSQLPCASHPRTPKLPAGRPPDSIASKDDAQISRMPLGAFPTRRVCPLARLARTRWRALPRARAHPGGRPRTAGNRPGRPPRNRW